jgi:prepilin-type N-terminal cleavage/methylation domain-containing protein
MNGTKKGFTLMEVMIAGGLMSLLAAMLSFTWTGFGRPAADAVTRSRLAQEMRLAVSCLARDFGGGLANPEGRTGSKIQGRLIGQMITAPSQFWLCFDGGSDPNDVPDWGYPDTVIVYLLDGDRLVRWDQNANSTFVAARDLSAMNIADLGDRWRIQLVFRHRGVERSCSLTMRKT